MALILNIDTSTEAASVSLAKDGEVLSFIENNIQKEHASFLHIAIKELLKDTGFEELDAVAVTEGPGSYTGLRVGMASAKGLCYALNKAFITIGTLDAMAFAAINTTGISSGLYCPMIDARRLEVYTALYKNNMEEIIPASAVVLSEHFLQKELNENKIVFCGSGILKWKNVAKSLNAVYLDEIKIHQSFAALSYKKFTEKRFTELAHSQPLYVKDFYNSN